jgi:hypothetical protein
MTEFERRFWKGRAGRVPPLPTVRELTRDLRELHEAWAHPESGPCEVYLYVDGAGWNDANWRLGSTREGWPGPDHYESGCGGAGFDPVAAARRLHAAARDLMAS